MTSYQSNPNERFIYDEISGRLYAPSGRLIKTIDCPKAKHWNQLLIDDGDGRTRGCSECGERVLDLDSQRVRESLDVLHLNPDTCVHAASNSEKVIFLNPRSNFSHHEGSEEANPSVLLKTVRSLADINRYAAMGFWPDVRLVKYKANDRVLKDGYLRLVQDSDSGRLKEVEVDHPRNRHKSTIYTQATYEVIPPTRYYSGFQPIPIAAYLIPMDLVDGTEVTVEDPIEDVVNGYERAFNVPAIVIDRKVQLQLERLEVRRVVG